MVIFKSFSGSDIPMMMDSSRRNASTMIDLRVNFLMRTFRPKKARLSFLSRVSKQLCLKFVPTVLSERSGTCPRFVSILVRASAMAGEILLS